MKYQYFIVLCKEYVDFQTFHGLRGGKDFQGEGNSAADFLPHHMQLRPLYWGTDSSCGE